MSSKADFAWGLFFGFALGVILMTYPLSSLRGEAIKHGVAQYNAQTAAFEWKECGK